MKTKLAILSTLMFAGSLAAVSPTYAAAGVNAGLLTCNVADGTGFIIGSSKEMTCTFERTNGTTETYSGTIKKFGLDIGKTKQTTIKWLVLAPSENIDERALVGDYGGLSAEATAGVGAGANAMVGGSKSNIVLQPFSGQVQEGLNIAVGIGTMSLR